MHKFKDLKIEKKKKLGIKYKKDYFIEINIIQFKFI